MPHVIVKLLPGRSEQQKVQLAQQIVKDVVRIANTDDKSVSVAIVAFPKSNLAGNRHRPE